MEILLIIITILLLWIISILLKLKNELTWINKNEERNREYLESSNSTIIQISDQLFHISSSVDSKEKDTK